LNGIGPMQRFSTWARWITVGLAVVVFIFKDVVVPVFVDFIKEQPETNDFLHWVLKLLLDFAQQSWVHVAAWILLGFVAGLWVDWLLRKADGSRAEKRKELGYDMLKLARNLADYARRINGNPMNAFRPQIASCLTRARKVGMWVPDDRIFSIYPPHRAMDLIVDYLTRVGQMLRDGNFSEAQSDAKKLEANFNKT
jgi:hypothetical protein